MRVYLCLLLTTAASWGAPTTPRGAEAAPAQPVLDLPSTMLAAKDMGSTSCSAPVHGKGGSFDCVETTSVSVPKPIVGEALVRMNVSSVNPSDVDMVEGKFGRLFGTLGADFAGVVVAVGPLCHRLKVSIPQHLTVLVLTSPLRLGMLSGVPQKAPMPSMLSWSALLHPRSLMYPREMSGPSQK